LLVGLRPRSAVSERLATSCVLPLLLAGVLGAPGKRKELADYSRKLLFEDNSMENRPAKHTLEIINAIRFIWFVYPAYYIFKIGSSLLPIWVMSFVYNAAYMKKTRV
jgi:hypothetical protein